MTEETALTVQEPGRVPDLGKPPSYLDKMQPQTFGELVTFAGIVAKAGWAPKSYESGGKADPDKIVIGMMQGIELGLKPLASLQNIAVVNGIPSVYGDAMLGLVSASGLLDDFEEAPIMKGSDVVGYTCRAVRKGRPTPIVQTFTTDDAKAAGLLNKAGPWTQYRTRMLQMRARALCLRDGFPDVLKGLYSAEEAQDIGEAKDVTPPRLMAAKTATGKLDAFASAPAKETVVEAEPHDPETGEVKGDGVGLPVRPQEVQEAITKGRYGPFLQWLAGELHERPQDQRQPIADDQMVTLNAAMKSSDAAKAMVEKLAADFGVELLDSGDGE